MTCACTYENSKVIGLCGAHMEAFKDLYAYDLKAAHKRSLDRVTRDMEHHVRVLKAPPTEQLPVYFLERWIGELGGINE
jgi:hypothetical protein